MTGRLVMVEDHGLLAETVGAALRVEGYDVAVVHAPRTDDVVAEVRGLDPDLVLCDLDLGGGADAVDLLPALTAQGVPVLMVTGVTDLVPLARCVRNGAAGIVHKGEGIMTLLDAVPKVLANGTLLTHHEREEWLDVLRRHERLEHDRLAPFAELTPREAEVLRSLCQGRLVEEIARDAVVSVSTVRSQVRAILRKLGVGSQLAATALAHETGWFGRRE